LQAIPENEILRLVYDVFIDRCDLSILLGEEEQGIKSARPHARGRRGGEREKTRKESVR